MDGGVVHGVGMKGKVMDYQDIHVKHVQQILVYIKRNHTIVEKEVPVEELDTLLQLDKKKEYVVKEFLTPPLPMRLQGYTNKTYMLRELKGIQPILSLVDGIPYKNTTLYGFELINEETHCFTVVRKCKDTLQEKPMSLYLFRRLVVDVLTDLVKLQQQSIAHGDIKLDNIMKCKTYKLIDWENSRILDYDTLVKQRYLGASPMYFQILYGPAWYPAFKIALFKYHKEFGVENSIYSNALITHFSSLFQRYTPKEVFEKTKYTLDVGTFGHVLYGIMSRSPGLYIYRTFIMNMYRMTAKEALAAFRKNQTRRK